MDVYAKMPFVDPAYQSAYQQAFDDFSGNKHFWRSEMTVHRRDDFYASVKMVSSRVAGAESCNSENVQGYHLGDGATYFYQSNKEYNDIFPFWDWKMIPGTTTFHGPDSLPVLPCEGGYHIESDFVGGLSNGINGVATLAYNRDKLSAKKSYFFFDDAVICLGAGISTTETKEVRTTINQSFLHGSVHVKTEANLKTLPEGQHSLPSVNWVVHDNWGYFFPKGAKVELTNREQTGQWNHLLKRVPPKELKANLFTLYMDHQSQPTDANYAYFVFPKADANTMAARGAAISVVQNSKEQQVIEIAQKGMAGFVFYTAGEATTKSFQTVSVSQPCVLIMDKKGSAVQVTVADPTHKLTSITIGISGRKKSKTVPSIYDAAGNRTLFTVSLPQGSEAGRSLTFAVL